MVKAIEMVEHNHVGVTVPIFKCYNNAKRGSKLYLLNRTGTARLWSETDRNIPILGYISRTGLIPYI